MNKQLVKIDYPDIKEELWNITVDPGLQLFILPKAGYKKKYATFTTHFGSIDNSFRVEGNSDVTSVPDGVAHFLEHKMFESKQGDTFAKFAELGASANAYTEFAITSYLFSAVNNFERSLEVLLDFVQDPYFTEENVEKEKGIIGQEIRMYEDDPEWRVFFDLLGALYKEHPVRRDIAGTIESISKITADTLFTCYNAFYHPSNMAVFVTGDVEPERVADQVIENISRHGHRPQGDIYRFYPQEPRDIFRKKAEAKLDVSEPMINIGFKERAFGEQGLLYKDVLTNLLLEVILGSGSLLYNDLYQEGLIDEDFDAGYSVYNSFAHTLIGGRTKDPDALYDRIMGTIAEVRNKGIKEEDFNRIKRKMRGEFFHHLNSLEFIAGKFNAYYFKGTNLLEYLDQLKLITLEDVNTRLRDHLNPDMSAVSLVLPE